MRHIQIPEPVTLVTVFDANGVNVIYTMELLNRQNVWNSPRWRDENKLDMCFRIADKFKGTKYTPGSWVSLTDEEYEAYAPLATLKGEKLNPEMALELMQVMRPIVSAPHELPGEEKKPEVTVQGN